MDKESLVKEIIKTCKYFRVFNKKTNNEFLTRKISKNLKDIFFVENLLNVLYHKMRSKRFQKTLNKNRLKKLLIELEKRRLNLEFKGVIK